MTATRSGPLRVALTFDTDADFFDSSLADSGKLPLPGWRGVAEGIPLIIEEIRQLRDTRGKQVRATWFVRSDNQLAELHGTHTYLLEEFAPLWEQCVSSGDEIAWHPHVYRRAGDAWVQETDPSELRRKLFESHSAVCRVREAPRCSRIGEAYCSNEAMEALEALRIRADSTAMPGRRRVDEHRTIDWEPTPTHPYSPSVADYRVPGEPSRNLIEVPMSMVPVRADYDAGAFLRYVDLSFHPRALGEGLRQHVAGSAALVTMTHPSGVLPDLVTRPHGLVAFSIASFRENVGAILGAAELAGREVEFVTISELVSREMAA